MVTLRGSSSTCAAIHANGRSRTPRCSTANGAQTAPSCSCPRSRSSGSFRRRSRNSRRGSGPRASASTKALENARQAQAVMATAVGQASSKCVRSHAAERCAHRTPARIRCARFIPRTPIRLRSPIWIARVRSGKTPIVTVPSTICSGPAGRTAPSSISSWPAAGPGRRRRTRSVGHTRAWSPVNRSSPRHLRLGVTDPPAHRQLERPPAASRKSTPITALP
jgi:hypothetical protein